jgi:DNA-binding LacI/PurR family transcriptional regulator
MSWHKVITGGITSVRLPEQEIARASFDLLVAAKTDQAQSKISIKPHLIKRGSSPQIPPCQPELTVAISSPQRP